MLPDGYYEIYYTVTDANGAEVVVGSLPIIHVAEGSNTNDNTDNDNTDNDNTNNNNTNNDNNNTSEGMRVVNSSSSGCNAGHMGLFAAVLAAFALKMKRR